MVAAEVTKPAPPQIIGSSIERTHCNKMLEETPYLKITSPGWSRETGIADKLTKCQHSVHVYEPLCRCMAVIVKIFESSSIRSLWTKGLYYNVEKKNLIKKLFQIGAGGLRFGRQHRHVAREVDSFREYPPIFAECPRRPGEWFAQQSKHLVHWQRPLRRSS